MNDKDHDSGTPKPKGKVRLGLICFILLLLIGGGLVAGFIPRKKSGEEAQKDMAELSQTTVTLVSPEPGKPEEGPVLPADVQPILQASIYARVDGYLKKWVADIGARVKEGDVLAEIETPEADRALEQAKAEVNSAEVNLKLTQATDTRSQGLLKVAAVSKQQADERTAAVGVAQAALDAQKANVKRLEELQGFQKVIAPFDGIVTARNVDIGDLISSGGGKELFHLAQTQTLRVYVRVPQTQASGIAPGQAAELLIPEMPGEKFPAKVITTAESLAANTRTLLTQLQVDNAAGKIRAGSYAQVRFASLAKPALLTLPASALIFRAEGMQVATVNGDNMVQLRKIELGRDYGQRVEVLSGVAAGDKIIASPFDSLVDGMKVRIAENEKKPEEKKG